jgi:hypothetical protein
MVRHNRVPAPFAAACSSHPEVAHRRAPRHRCRGSGGGIQTAVVMLLVAASALLGVYLTEQQLPQRRA